MESAKRRAPSPVPPVVVDGLRYEALHDARRHGFAHDGGVVAVIDDRSGRTLRLVQLYATPHDGAEERDAQEVYVKALALDADGRALKAVDEHGRAWLLDLASSAVTRA